MLNECFKVVLERPAQKYHAAICFVSITYTDLENKIIFLHNQELNFYQSLLHAYRRTSYLSGRIAAKTAVSQLTGTADASSIIIDVGIFNQPVVKAPQMSGIQVSISHCKNMALAIAFPEDHPMGIDIEQIDEKKADALRNVITAKEAQMVSIYGLSFLVGGTMLWSAKESLSKTLKTGFTTDPRIFEIDDFKRVNDNYVCTFTHFTQYKVLIDFSQSYICSIALPLYTNIALDEFSIAFRNMLQRLN